MVFWMNQDREGWCLSKLTAQWWQLGSCRISLPGANTPLLWWAWQSTDSPKWRLLEQFSISLPLDPALLWAGIWHFGWCEKKKSNVGMKWAILNASWNCVQSLPEWLKRKWVSEGFPYASAQAKGKQPSLVICGLPWLVKMVMVWLTCWPSREPSADRSVPGGFDQVGLCNPAKTSSNTHLQRNIVQWSLIYLQGKYPSEKERNRETCWTQQLLQRNNQPVVHCMHRADLTPVCTQWHNLSIIHWNNWLTGQVYPKIKAIEIKGSFHAEFKSFWASSCSSHQLYLVTWHETGFLLWACRVIEAGGDPCG